MDKKFSLVATYSPVAMSTLEVDRGNYQTWLSQHGGPADVRVGLTNFDDVEAFHIKFGVPLAGAPSFLDREANEFRVKFMQEELDEFKEDYANGDMLKAADALVDLVYVAMGTASMMGLPWQQLWDEVQRANMSKVRASGADDARSVRKSALDVVKPEGWKGPDHRAAVGDGANWPTFYASSGGNPIGAVFPATMFEAPTQKPAVDMSAGAGVPVDAVIRMPAEDTEGGV
jgi:predicted HAD superfamily Cof-like phosphohydrolase